MEHFFTHELEKAVSINLMEAHYHSSPIKSDIHRPAYRNSSSIFSTKNKNLAIPGEVPV